MNRVSESFSSGPAIIVSSRSAPMIRLAASTKGCEKAHPRCFRPMPTRLEPWLSGANLSGEQQHQSLLHQECAKLFTRNIECRSWPGRCRLGRQRVCFLELADGLVLELEELGELGEVQVLPLLDEGVGLVTLSEPAAPSLPVAWRGPW